MLESLTTCDWSLGQLANPCARSITRWASASWKPLSAAGIDACRSASGIAGTETRSAAELNPLYALLNSEPNDPPQVHARCRGTPKHLVIEIMYTIGYVHPLTYAHWEVALRYCQALWMSGFQAASSVSEVVESSTSLPFSKVAPSRTSFTRWGALTARHFDCAASISL